MGITMHLLRGEGSVIELVLRVMQGVEQALGDDTLGWANMR